MSWSCRSGHVEAELMALIFEFIPEKRQNYYCTNVMLECRGNILSDAPRFEVGDWEEIGNRIVSGLSLLASVFSHERIKASLTRILV